MDLTTLPIMFFYNEHLKLFACGKVTVLIQIISFSSGQSFVVCDCGVSFFKAKKMQSVFITAIISHEFNYFPPIQNNKT